MTSEKELNDIDYEPLRYDEDEDDNNNSTTIIIGFIIALVVLVGAFLAYKFVYVPKQESKNFSYAYEIGEKAKLKDVYVVIINRNARSIDSEIHEFYTIMIENSSVLIHNVDEKKLTKWKP